MYWGCVSPAPHVPSSLDIRKVGKFSRKLRSNNDERRRLFHGVTYRCSQLEFWVLFRCFVDIVAKSGTGIRGTFLARLRKPRAPDARQDAIFLFVVRLAQGVVVISGAVILKITRHVVPEEAAVELWHKNTSFFATKAWKSIFVPEHSAPDPRWAPPSSSVCRIRPPGPWSCAARRTSRPPLRRSGQSSGAGCLTESWERKPENHYAVYYFFFCRFGEKSSIWPKTEKSLNSIIFFEKGAGISFK